MKSSSCASPWGRRTRAAASPRGTARTVSAQIQSLGQNDLAQAEQTSNTRVDRKAYLYAPNPALPPQGIVRPLARNGDMLQRADGTWWLVTAMIEDFTASGWVCVGITQQVRGPDLSASDAEGGSADA